MYQQTKGQYRFLSARFQNTRTKLRMVQKLFRVEFFKRFGKMVRIGFVGGFLENKIY